MFNVTRKKNKACFFLGAFDQKH